MKYRHNKIIKDYLQRKKYTNLTIKNGLNYLIPRWKQSIDTFCDADLIYEYVNDLTRRRIIDEILEFLTIEERQIVQEELIRIDNKFRKKTFEINECVCGKKIEKKYGYNRIKNWYYYRITASIFDTEKKFTRKV